MTSLPRLAVACPPPVMSTSYKPSKALVPVLGLLLLLLDGVAAQRYCGLSAFRCSALADAYRTASQTMTTTTGDDGATALSQA